MDLAGYLNRYFPDGDSGSINDEAVALVSHFISKFGVDVRVEDDLYQFQYNMLSVKWGLPIAHECRGSILRHRGAQWSYASRPYDKFFNLGEQFCRIDDSNFDNKFQIIEKADGTCIQAWHDDERGAWRISTLGTINCRSYDNTPEHTFDKLFLRTIGDLQWSRLDKGYTYLFELCTFDNRIVTQYPSDVVYLIAAREREHGLYLPDQEVDDLCLRLMEDGLNIRRPALRFLYEFGLECVQDVRDWVEKQAEDKSYGEWPEGFVLYRGGIPTAKIKNSKYLQAFHACGSGNKGHARNVIIDSIFAGTLDDIYPVLIPEMQKFAEGVREKVGALQAKALTVAEAVSRESCSTAKEYAFAVQRHCHDPSIRGFLFLNRERVMAGLPLAGQFDAWLRDHYEAYDKHWKAAPTE